MTVDTNRVVSKSQVITGHITLFNFDTPITNLELADKTADNDNDKFDTTK
ncbi:hypothetical protein FACS1894166_03310 [Bacilli bacterium]|nr:hypothetical protein FACS1894166_03310 [Bacilli bacterium]